MTVEMVLRHELVALDANGRLCACGGSFDLEHLGMVALSAVGAPLSIDQQREQARAVKARSMAERRRRERAAVASSDVDRLTVTRRILLDQQREWERIGSYLDELGLDFLDRMDWLEEHYPNARTRERYDNSMKESTHG